MRTEKDKLFKYFNSLSELTQKQFENFLSITHIEHLVAGDLFISPQKNRNKIGIVLCGCLKSYFLTPEGNQHIRAFLSQHDVCAALSSNKLNFFPDLFAESLTDTKILYFDYVDFLKLSVTSMELKDLAYKLLELEFIKNEKKEYNFTTKKIEDNYFIINDEIKAKEINVMQKDIANYLGITDIAYSRIKKRLSNKRSGN